MLVVYSIISTIIAVSGYLVYKIFLAGRCQHSFNRVVILLLYALSLIMPFFVMMKMADSSSADTARGGGLNGAILPEIFPGGGGEPESARFGVLGSGVVKLITSLYFTGVGVMLFYSLVGAVILYRLMCRGEELTGSGFRLRLTDRSDIAPFCFRHTIVMGRKDFEESGEMILTHECMHLKLNHWADMVLSQIVICIQWYNPAAWALRKELKMIHEYQADEAVLDTGADPKEYQMLLVRKAAGPHLQLFADSLSHSKLKKRVTMMYKEKTSLAHRLGALLIVPAIAAGCALTTIPSVAGVLESFAEASVSAAPDKEGEIYTSVEQTAEFPGGMVALMKFLSENIRYPEEAHKNDIQGRVIVRFVIEKDGTVGDASILKGVDPLLDAEAIRVTKLMPKWQPAKVNGQDVASYFALPVSFKLSTTEDSTPKSTNNE